MNKTNQTEPQLPDERGKFGPYGGQFVPETLMPAIEELIQAYKEARADPAFDKQLAYLLDTYVGRPSPLVSRPSFFMRVL